MESPAPESKNTRRGQKPWPVIIMIAMLATVIISGVILAPRTEEAKMRWLEILGTTNHGEFLNPPVKLENPLLDESGGEWSPDEEQPWKLILANRGDCSVACQQMADLTQRVHIRLNRLSPEVKLGYLGYGGGTAPDEALGFEVLQPASELPDRLSMSGAPSLEDGPLLLVMDPLEVIFLFYGPEHEGGGMLEDLEHVIELAR